MMQTRDNDADPTKNSRKFASSWERDGQEAEIKEKGRKIAHPTLNMSRRESFQVPRVQY